MCMCFFFFFLNQIKFCWVRFNYALSLIILDETCMLNITFLVNKTSKCTNGGALNLQCLQLIIQQLHL